MAMALVAVRLVHAIDRFFGLESSLGPDTTRSVLGTLAGAMFTFIIFVCSSLLLVVQLASTQLTPRVVGTMFRDSVTKLGLATFVFTFIFVLATLLRIEDTVPLLLSQVAAYGCAVSVGVFLFIIDHVGKLLRPSGAFRSVANQAHQVIDQVYPRRFADAQVSSTAIIDLSTKTPDRTVRGSKAGVVLAFDIDGIVRLAQQHDCLIELCPQVGKFVAPGDALFRVYGSTADLQEVLGQSIALGEERTVEQDPAFAFRAIVDIACKGLSPAINDPTTAVLAIDRIHHLLRHVGGRQLDNDRVCDSDGRVRLIYRTPGWEDFVSLAVTEIRQYGASSIQVMRRLRAMLEDLIEWLPEDRSAPLRRELKLLKKSADRAFREPDDRALASESDSQGMGSTQEAPESIGAGTTER